jgi:alpha-mannosidase
VENARLLAFKRAEDDEGWIVRLHNPAPHPVTASLSFPGFPVTTFCPTNVIEENMAPYESVNGSVMIHISTAGLATLRLPAPNIPLLSGD